MATIHNRAEKGQIAETILLPGDPLRARFIAQEFMTEATLFNDVRGMEGYTGWYKNCRISVMGTGMGCASLGIYTHELAESYGCKNLIRIGSCGGISEKVRVGDLLISMAVSTDSGYLRSFDFDGSYSPCASFSLLEKAAASIRELNKPFHVGNTFCTDVFYRKHAIRDSWREMGILGVEMEAYALYCNAAMDRVNAVAIMTVTDDALRDVHMTSMERERSLSTMITAGLNTAVRCVKEGGL